MTNEHIKSTSLKYSTSEKGTGIYLDLEFTEEGSKIIEDLSSNEYKTIEKEESKEDKKENNKREESNFIKDIGGFLESTSSNVNVNNKEVFTNMMNTFSSYNSPYGGIKMYFEQETLFIYDDYNVRVW